VVRLSSYRGGRKAAQILCGPAGFFNGATGGLAHYDYVAPKTSDGQPTFGNAGRGILIGPSLTNFDFALARNFNFSESKWLEFRWEAFNLFNTPQFGLPASNISSRGNVGRITTLAGDPRVMRFALKLVF